MKDVDASEAEQLLDQLLDEVEGVKPSESRATASPSRG
jgi:hypothetical protein